MLSYLISGKMPGRMTFACSGVRAQIVRPPAAGSSRGRGGADDEGIGALQRNLDHQITETFVPEGWMGSLTREATPATKGTGPPVTVPSEAAFGAPIYSIIDNLKGRQGRCKHGGFIAASLRQSQTAGTGLCRRR